MLGLLFWLSFVLIAGACAFAWFGGVGLLCIGALAAFESIARIFSSFRIDVTTDTLLPQSPSKAVVSERHNPRLALISAIVSALLALLGFALFDVRGPLS